jgi:hypothetical protein
LLKIQIESKLGNKNIQKFISFSHHLRKKKPLIISKNGINKNNATAMALNEGNTKLNILNIKFTKNKTERNPIITRFSNGWFLLGLKNLNNCFMKFSGHQLWFYSTLNKETIWDFIQQQNRLQCDRRFFGNYFMIVLPYQDYNNLFWNRSQYLSQTKFNGTKKTQPESHIFSVRQLLHSNCD